MSARDPTNVPTKVRCLVIGTANGPPHSQRTGGGGGGRLCPANLGVSSRTRETLLPSVAMAPVEAILVAGAGCDDANGLYVATGRWELRVAYLTRSPSDWCPFTVFFLGEGSPTRIDCRKKGYPYSDLSTGGHI